MFARVDPLTDFYRYEPAVDIHVVDCSGYVDLQTGVTRLQVLQSELAANPPRNGVSRLLIDFRHTVWSDESVHLELSRRTRAELLRPDNLAIRAAILNTRWSGQISDNEQWFLSTTEAREWLCEPLQVTWYSSS